MDHSNHEHHVHPLESTAEYLKFAAVILAIFLVSLGLAWTREWSPMGFMEQFMAVFFLVFAGFKLANLQMFAVTFRGYDIVTKKFSMWGYIYPFVQVGLGLGYLVLGALSWLILLTIGISLVAAIGVVRELSKKSDIPCACLGNVIKLPLSKISFVEDFGMLAMAVAMLAL